MSGAQGRLGKNASYLDSQQKWSGIGETQKQRKWMLQMNTNLDKVIRVDHVILLKKNLDGFARPKDMPKIDPKVINHKLSDYPYRKLVQ